MRVKVKLNFRSYVRDGRLHKGISPGETYFVIGVSDDSLRIVDDKGEPILYPKELFETLDNKIPAGWQFREYAEGEYYLDPIATGVPGFYEEFFGSDGDLASQSKARQALREALEATSAGANEDDRRILERDLARLIR